MTFQLLKLWNPTDFEVYSFQHYKTMEPAILLLALEKLKPFAHMTSMPNFGAEATCQSENFPTSGF